MKRSWMSASLPLCAAMIVMLSSTVVTVSAVEDILSCYTCTSTDADATCYTDPDNSGSVPVTECSLGKNQCCIIQRIDSKENLGSPITMFRGCIPDCDKSLIGEMVETPDFMYVTYQTYCDEHKCNNGPGNIAPGSNTGDGDYIDGILGKDGSAIVTASLLLVVVCLAMHYVSPHQNQVIL